MSVMYFDLSLSLSLYLAKESTFKSFNMFKVLQKRLTVNKNQNVLANRCSFGL